MDYLRQLDWFDPKKHSRISVTIVGAGGIGGPVALALAKLGVPRIKVYDHDTVEEHNQPNQIYGPRQISRAKVYALEETIHDLTGLLVDGRKIKLTPNTNLKGIVIGAVDSMDARRAVWSAVKAAGPRVPLYIDGRIGGQVIRVLTVRPNVKRDVVKYEKSLVPNHAVVPMPCTQAGIIDVSFSVGALITRAFRLAIEQKERIFDLYYDHRNLRFQKG